MTHTPSWVPEDKVRIVMDSLSTSMTMAELYREYNVTPVTSTLGRTILLGREDGADWYTQGPWKELQNENMQKMIF